MISKLVDSTRILDSELISEHYQRVIKYTDGASINCMSIQSWISTPTRENLMLPNESTNPISTETNQNQAESHQSNSVDTASSSEIKIPEKDSIDSFEKFQQSNIMKLSEAIAGKSSQEAIDYLNSIQ